MASEQHQTRSKSHMVNEVAVRYEVRQENSYLMVKKAQDGIPANAFFDMLSVSGLTKKELSGLLDISFKTVQRYQKENKKLNALNSEQLLKMISLYQKAEELFGSIDAFNRWLRKPAIGLGSQKPLRLMQTPGGIDLISEELSRIEHGILA